MKTKKFLFNILLIIGTGIIITACYKNKNYNNNGANNYTISMKNGAYAPASLTVASGSQITWMNDDNVIHTVTTADGNINSGDIAVGSSFSKTFSTAGTFNYYDAHNTAMTGILVVTSSSSGGGGSGY